ncbi:hypothetical protein OG730_42350 (plasmid) [Streptomyces sp. NBC_01298]|uniref:hypothetical protein n=1 Tax=Streptomyces sp. NBC_01298 TaxID=2903817 RepID=UPI002E0FC80E|nr:hypothetical protein OG730_42350 [Streptomyces sp. NBC_01298]
MFDTHSLLDAELTGTRAWSALYAAVLDSSHFAAQAIDDKEVTGLRFFEPSPGVRAAMTVNGTVTIEPGSGAVTLEATGITGPRWFAALHRLGTLDPNEDGTPFWTWRPHAHDQPGVLAGSANLGPRITAETLITRHGSTAATAAATLCLTPATRETCHIAWSLAASALGTLTTGNAAYRSDILPAPDPEVFTASDTDYQAAAQDVAYLCERLDENVDFGYARDHDPTWPTDAERAAVLALRGLHDALSDRATP